jgi:hypothetical protein
VVLADGGDPARKRYFGYVEFLVLQHARVAAAAVA